MLSNYLKKSEAVTSGGLETDPVFNGSIAKGITATDTSYWNRKLNTSDTSGMLANYRTGLNQKLNITDTAKMLVPYLRDADTTNMLANYITSINNKLDAKDTSLMLSSYVKKSEGFNETDPLFNGSIAKGITATDTSFWNRKLNSSDTSRMLAIYKNTLIAMAPLNNPTFTGTVSGIDKNMVGLGNLDNTSDANKPISSATQMVINGKVNIADTAAMLANYLKKSDSLYSNLNDLMEQINLLKIITNYPVIDGYSYKIVKIGNQFWMKENLRTTKYRNGEAIITGLDDTSWFNTGNGAYAIYNNDVINENIYGMLYNWYAVNDPRGLCPTGWHVPSQAEWSILISYLGGSGIAGGKMKAAGTSYWNTPNGNASNLSGFTAFPGGSRHYFGPFSDLQNKGYFWSSTASTPNEDKELWRSDSSWSRNLNFSNGSVENNVNLNLYQSGFSVRCIKD
jgi:uncharacterized protein (TIGR02145 family)